MVSIWKVLSRFPSMLRPRKAAESFRKIRDEKLRATIMYPTVILLIESAIMSAGGFYVLKWLLKEVQLPYKYALHLTAIALIPFTVIAGIATLLAFSTLIHIPVRIMGGKAGYSQTFKAVAYGSTPTMATLIVPPIMILTIPWSLLIITIGLKELHQTTWKRAATPIIALIIVGIAVAIAGIP